MRPGEGAGAAFVQMGWRGRGCDGGGDGRGGLRGGGWGWHVGGVGGRGGGPERQSPEGGLKEISLLTPLPSVLAISERVE
ncbi:unnamed protein product [Dicrocoelium dendriticum]|nr:unnamed protein product [Dicrocoelium dendriticum]